jgi:hypothetical protein
VLAVPAAAIVVHRDAIADLDCVDARAEGFDDAARFVSRDGVVAGTLGSRLPVEVQVAATQACGFDPDDDLARAGLWIGKIPHLCPSVARKNDASHAVPPAIDYCVAAARGRRGADP